MFTLLRLLLAVVLVWGLAACEFSESSSGQDSVEVAPESEQPPADVEDSVDPDASEQDETASPGPTPTPAPRSGLRGDALTALATLKVKGRAPMTGYTREMFGPAWMDTDRNGCDTRNDILAAYLSATQVESNGCVVTSGVLADLYTGTSIYFYRGHGALVDVDHVVALANSWATGSSTWSMQQRAALANDPLNLLPVDASANRQKGDGDAATWLPPHKRFRCAYVARQVTVKQKYALWVTRPEAAAIERILATCPGEPLTEDTAQLPTATDQAVREPVRTSSPAPKPKPARTKTPAPARLTPVHYQNCTAARDAGAAPVRAGEPGYGRHLDRDGDGVGCE
ncbi:excalibur calcium-binding domain-containing protein [Nocardioides gilvus]|uniref:excalibur calcium-binding domain-containing protein n=1 Tax=Nocardioides gilvus TaxID=1735589 RepID=UPI000D74D6B9|nr:excalibur calcium-binding domain-containing protein [Nocardioides gilvus]